MASNPALRLTEEEYLAIDRAAQVKSEFVNGQMFAMAGGTTHHSRLQVDLSTALNVRLMDAPCETFSADQRIKVEATGLNTYPDVSVVCGKIKYAERSEDTIVNPTVLFEVLSSSTESHDRGEKFHHYRRIESLTDYVLVAQSAMQIEHFTRAEAGAWTWRTYSNPDEELRIDSIGVAIPLREIYRRVQFDEQPASARFPA